MTDNRPGSNNNIRQFVRRIEALNEEIDLTKQSIKEIYSEAKSAGVDVSIMRKVIALRKKGMDKAEEEIAKIDHYLSILKNTDSDVIGE